MELVYINGGESDMQCDIVVYRVTIMQVPLEVAVTIVSFTNCHRTPTLRQLPLSLCRTGRVAMHVTVTWDLIMLLSFEMETQTNYNIKAPWCASINTWAPLNTAAQAISRQFCGYCTPSSNTSLVAENVSASASNLSLLLHISVINYFIKQLTNSLTETLGFRLTVV